MFLIPCVCKNNPQVCTFSAFPTFPASDWAERSPISILQSTQCCSRKSWLFFFVTVVSELSFQDGCKTSVSKPDTELSTEHLFSLFLPSFFSSPSAHHLEKKKKKKKRADIFRWPSDEENKVTCYFQVRSKQLSLLHQPGKRAVGMSYVTGGLAEALSALSTLPCGWAWLWGSAPPKTPAFQLPEPCSLRCLPRVASGELGNGFSKELAAVNVSGDGAPLKWFLSCRQHLALTSFDIRFSWPKFLQTIRSYVMFSQHLWLISGVLKDKASEESQLV